MTITNDGVGNITLTQVYTNIHNVTYVDGTFEKSEYLCHTTLIQVLQPGESYRIGWTTTVLGFVKEPKTIWVTVEASFSELEIPPALTTGTPEFPSFLVLPTFMIATLLAVAIYRRKLATKCVRAV